MNVTHRVRIARPAMLATILICSIVLSGGHPQARRDAIHGRNADNERESGRTRSVGPDEETAAPPESLAREGREGTLYTVATAHLDTQWLWTIQDTINEYVPKTLRENFERFEKHPHYVFSFEGAFRYMLAKEYYPAEYARLKEYIARGRWHVAGSAIDAGDTNIPAPESLIRHVLYANLFFEREFGKRSQDIFLPDCFGFGYALPSVAAHCGLKGFSTQKLTWGSSVGIPFPVGTWEGVDGSALVAALDPGEYVSTIREDLSRSGPWLEKVRKLGRETGVAVGYRYFGVGDTGGAPDEESVGWLEKSLAGEGPLRVLSAAADRMYQDLTPQQLARLPRYKGEMLMTRHGVGCYTSQAAMKRWNRKNERLAAAAEAASVVADWMEGAAYPREKLTDAWIRFLWHHHHDDLTGTSTPLAYPFSWNDEALSQNAFSAVLADAGGAVIRALDTRAAGTAVVVFNPLSFEREGVVEATLRFRGKPPRAIRVYGPDGKETPSQIIAVVAGRETPSAQGARAPGTGVEGASARGPRAQEVSAPGSRVSGAGAPAASTLEAGVPGASAPGVSSLRVLFLARIPSLGFAVYDARPSATPCAMTTGLRVTPSTLESSRYHVRLDRNGDVASVHDRLADRPLLAGPARLQLLEDRPDQWPEWEISHADIVRAPREHVAAPASVRIVERGPVRVAIEVTRQAAGSIFTQRIRLSAGGAAATVDFDTRVDWQTPRTLVKAAFPLAVSNVKATYDLGLGTIQRGVNHEKLYEVPAQQWADITAEDGRYGVAVLNDCKYGWDRPDDGTLRLSLIHNPLFIEKDRGRHRFLYALAGHRGDWREGRVPMTAASLNQPLVAFQAPAHGGTLGKRFSFLRLDTPQVAVSALKKAEDGDEIIVRLFELHGRSAKDVRLSMAAPIIAARELTGAETPIGDGTPDVHATGDPLAESGSARTGLVIEGGSLSLSMEPYRPRTIALKLAPLDGERGAAGRNGQRIELESADRDGALAPSLSPRALAPPTSVPIALPFDVDAISLDEDRSDGDLDGRGHTLPGELLPRSIVSEGVRFEIGPMAPRAKNAVACRGQTLELPAGGYNRVYILAAARGGDTSGRFTIGSAPPLTLRIHDFTGFVGQSQSLVVDGRIVSADQLEEPFVKDATVAWVGTHRHLADARGAPESGAVDSGPGRPGSGVNEPYVFCYLFKYRLDLPAGSARQRPRITLPRNDAILVFAVSAALDHNDDAVPASELGDRVVTMRIRPKGGLAIEPVTVTLSCDQEDATIRYTLNGLEPTLADAAYTKPLRIDRDTTVRARAFVGTHAEEDVAVRRFRFTKPRPADRPDSTVPGLIVRCFEGAWRDVGGFASLAPVRTGAAETISPRPRTRDLDFGLEFTGYIEVPRDGVYTFFTRSDDGSTLTIGEQLVVDNDGLHGSVERSGAIALSRGMHPLTVRFFQRGGDIDLEVSYEGPGIARQPIPGNVFYRPAP